MKYNSHPEDFRFSGKESNTLSIKANLNCLFLRPGHTFALGSLVYSENTPQKHKNPSDRLLICQAKVEDMLFLTYDHLIPYNNENCIIFV